jgi:hypothetical protein
MEIGTAKIRQAANEIAWRHLWLNHVMTETGERRPGEIAQRIRNAKRPLIARLHQLRRLKSTIGAGSSFDPSGGRN